MKKSQHIESQTMKKKEIKKIATLVLGNSTAAPSLKKEDKWRLTENKQRKKIMTNVFDEQEKR